jgi:opacity protein-like surface antigen
MSRGLAAVAMVAAITALNGSPAAAQVPSGDSAVVSVSAPIFLRPDATRTPLRTLAPDTPLTVLNRQGDWLQVTFEDRQLGRRTGWIEARFVRIRPGAPPPPPPAATPGAAPEAGAPAAQTPGAGRRAARRQASTGVGARLFGTFAIDKMAASQSFDAVAGSDVVLGYGGGVQVTNVWRGLFLEASLERASVDGERAFVHGEEVFPLGIPLELTMTPLDVVIGWRTPVGRATPYVSGGLTSFSYKETSDFADENENIDERTLGFVLKAGIETSLTRWIHLRAEARYRQVTDTLGVGGVSAAFDEDRLGGFGGAVSVLIGR